MSEAETTLSPGDTIGGKYKLGARLGQGGMGTVFQAENVQIGKRVAIKLLHPSFALDQKILARFRLEARAAAKIGHPGIVDVLDMDIAEDGSTYIVMEHLRGRPLNERMKQDGRMPPGQVARVGEGILDALAAAHAAGITHRDIKPANVFLVDNRTDNVKLLDFGISKFEELGDLSLTQTGALIGTPRYMSPEQFEMGGVGPPTDVYATGVLLFRALVGRMPYTARSLKHLRSQVTGGQRELLSQNCQPVDEPLALLIDQMMTQDPTCRPTALEARDRMRIIAAEFSYEVVITYPTEPPTHDGAPSSDEQALGSEANPTRSLRSQEATGLTAASPGRQVAGASGVPAASPRSATPSPGQAVGAAPSERPDNRRRNIAVAVGALLAAVAFVALSLTGGDDAPLRDADEVATQAQAPNVDLDVRAPNGVGQAAAVRQPAAQGVPALAEPSPPGVTLSIRAVPDEADVRISGQSGVCNPCQVTRPAGESVTATASLRGYKPVEQTLVFEAGLEEIELALEKLPRPSATRQRADKPTRDDDKRPITIDEHNPYAKPLKIDPDNPYQ